MTEKGKLARKRALSGPFSDNLEYEAAGDIIRKIENA